MPEPTRTNERTAARTAADNELGLINLRKDIADCLSLFHLESARYAAHPNRDVAEEMERTANVLQCLCMKLAERTTP